MSRDEVDPAYTNIGVNEVLDIPRDVFSDKAMAQAKKWLDQCLSSHEYCGAVVESNLPTRSLYIGVEGDPIFLVEQGQTGSMNSRFGVYVTLSHCWGSAPLMTTTKKTLEERKSGISCTALPKTFRDAVFVSRKLGFQYLWIDSLCILQDSKEDWAAESIRMQYVYANAALNISADVAINSSKGLNYGARLPVGVEVPQGSSSRIFARRWHAKVPVIRSGNHLQIAHSILSMYDRKLDILPTRGWVLQEYLLSPRILHFSENEMAWECDTHRSCECSPHVKPDKYTNANTRKFRWTLQNPDGYRGQEELFWKILIHDYSFKKLTYKTDRLTAISGLANRAASVSGRTYINGLWKEDLPICLAWNKRLSEAYPEESRIPGKYCSFPDRGSHQEIHQRPAPKSS